MGKALPAASEAEMTLRRLGGTGRPMTTAGVAATIMEWCLTFQTGADTAENGAGARNEIAPRTADDAARGRLRRGSVTGNETEKGIGGAEVETGKETQAGGAQAGVNT